MRRLPIIILSAALLAVILTIVFSPSSGPVVTGSISKHDLNQVITACGRLDGTIRSTTLDVMGLRGYLQQRSFDAHGRVETVDVLKSNRVAVTILKSGGTQSRYMVTNYRGEWRAAILGPQ